MRTNRWLNPTLPPILQYAVLLNYLFGAEALLGALGVPFFGGSSYAALATTNAQALLLNLVAAVAYGCSGYFVANEKKAGWIVAVVVAATSLVAPLLAIGRTPLSLISLLFNIVLLYLVAHPQSREYQRIWFK